MFNQRFTPSLLALAVVLGAASPTLAATPLHATTISFAGMFFGAGAAGDHGATTKQSWDANRPVLSALGGRATSTVTVGTPSGPVDDVVASTATAKWTDANHGQFHVVESAFAQAGDLSGLDFSPDEPADFGFADGRDFDYNFTATADGVLTLDSKIVAAGDSLVNMGRWSATVEENPHDFNRDPQPPLLFNGFGPGGTESAALQFNLVKGKTYSLEIFNLESQGFSTIVSEDAEFDFSIQDNVAGPGGPGGGPGGGAVPEPATWALMIAGLGGAGVMLRRHRQALVHA